MKDEGAVPVLTKVDRTAVFVDESSILMMDNDHIKVLTVSERGLDGGPQDPISKEDIGFIGRLTHAAITRMCTQIRQGVPAPQAAALCFTRDVASIACMRSVAFSIAMDKIKKGAKA